VVVDPKGIIKAATTANLTGGLAFYTEDETTDRHLKSRQETLDDPDMSLCPPRMPIFSLEEQKWFIVNVIELKEIAWNAEIIEKLELPKEQKGLLRALAQAHSLKDARRSGDMVEGKGMGLVLLFHGPSGVGKTLTAGKATSNVRGCLLTCFRIALRNHPKTIIQSESRDRFQ
jgi:hypothetical protein